MKVKNLESGKEAKEGKEERAQTEEMMGTRHQEKAPASQQKTRAVEPALSC